MIVSCKTNRKSRWVKAGVLLCAMIVLPLGITSAADYEAVERKLGEAVAEGQLSLDEAKLMLDTLRKSGGKYPSSHDKKQSYKKEAYQKEGVNLDGAWKKLQMMVKEGKIKRLIVVVDPDEMCFPMVKAGGSCDNVAMGPEDL